MKLETISSKTVLIGLLTVALAMASAGMALAGISKTGPDDYCNLCHTGGNATDGTTSQTCVECHSSSVSSTTYDLEAGGQTVTVPVVNYTAPQEPTTYLAGGNFWWVKEGKGGDDAKGHNVFYNEGDESHPDKAPGATFGVACNINSCHENLHLPYVGGDMGYNLPGKYGCQGCHLNVRHHADDHPNGQGGLVTTMEQGWYRFLSGHWTNGVEGYEDDNWEAGHPNLPQGTTDHNEYLGSASGGFLEGSSTHTTTAHCKGCHADFHTQESGESWIRHPSDAVIPSDAGTEYAPIATTYNPGVPLARPGGHTVWTGGPSGTVAPGTDMVMCLSCHRAHGSPYPKMLRWDLTGCKVCHTEK